MNRRSLFKAASWAAFFMARPARAHEWFSHKKDPVHGWGCCGGTDCNTFVISKTNVTAEEHGYRVRLSLEEARKINPYAMYPVDALVTWDRVQRSETDEWAICISASNRSLPAFGVFCFFEPPAT